MLVLHLLLKLKATSKPKHVFVIGDSSFQARIIKPFIRKSSNARNVYNSHCVKLEIANMHD